MSVIINHHYDANLSEFDGTSGGDISWSAGAGLAGSAGGISVLADDTVSDYGYKTLASPNTSGIIRARFYIDPNSATLLASSYHYVLMFRNSTPAYTVFPTLTYISSAYGIRVTYYPDTGAAAHTSVYTITDEPHYVEINYVRASSGVASDGSLQLWIDGVSKQTITGIDNYDRFFNLNSFYFGLLNQSNSDNGTVYLDELVVNDDGSEIGAVAGGTEYNQAVSGELTPAGALINSARKIVAGALTPAGEVVRSTLKVLEGTLTPEGVGEWLKQAFLSLGGILTPAGDLVKRTAISAAGILTPDGVVATVKAAMMSLAGELTPAGTLARQASKILAGAVTSSGTVAKSALKTFAGTITPAGVVAGVKTALVSLAGTLTPAGALVLRTAKTLAGTLTPAGDLIKQTGKTLVGSLAPDGSLVRRVSKVLAGILTSAGDLATQLTSGGTQYLQSVSGTLSASGALVKQTVKALAGSIAPEGGLLRRIAKSLAGVLSWVGSLVSSLGDIPGSVVVNDAATASVSMIDAAFNRVSITDAGLYSIEVTDG